MFFTFLTDLFKKMWCPRSVTLRGHHVHGHHVRGHHVHGHHVHGHHVHGHHVRGHHVHGHHGHRLTAGLQSQSIFYPFWAGAIIFPRLQLWSRLRCRRSVTLRGHFNTFFYVLKNSPGLISQHIDKMQVALKITMEDLFNKNIRIKFGWKIFWCPGSVTLHWHEKNANNSKYTLKK